MTSQTTDRARQLLLVEQDPADRALQGCTGPTEPFAVAMRDRIMSEAAVPAQSPRRGRVSSRSFRTLALAGTAVTLALLTTAAIVNTRATPALAALPIERAGQVAAMTPMDRADERATLLLVSRRAREASPLTPPVRVKSYEGWLQTAGGERPASRLVTLTRTVTANANGSGSDARQAAKPIWPSGEDRERWVGAGAPPEAANSNETRAAGELNHYSAPLEGLTTRELGDRIAAEVKSDSSDEADITAMRFKLLVEAFSEPTASPALRASLLELASTWSALQVRSRAVDQLGRTGISVSVVSDYSGPADVRYELILDPESGALLQRQDVLLERVAYVQAAPPVQLSFSIVAPEPER